MDFVFNTSELLTLLCTISILYLTSLAFYRLFLHPLAKFPGPKLAALTRYYEGYYDVVQGGRYTWKIAELHDKYGPIIRVSPYELHIRDPSFYEQLYRLDGRWNKYDWSYDAFGAPLSAICTADHDLHKRRRAPLNAYFSKSTVARSQHIVQERVDVLRTRIDELASTEKAFNLGAAFSALATDISTTYVLNRSHDSLYHDDFNEGMMNMLQGGSGIWRITKHVRFIGPLMKAMPLSFVEKASPDAKKFVEFLRASTSYTKQIMQSITSKLDDGSNNYTIIHAIMESDALPQKEKTLPRISDDVDTITGAGLETTAQTLRLLTYYLFTNKTILRRLRDELRSLNTKLPSSASSPSLSQLEQLPYLTAVIMEALRLAPGLATRLARIAPDREIVYAGKSIPAGTPVSMTALLMHWDEHEYPEPRAFDPDRWLDAERRKRAEKTFGPFSRGSRICIGMWLAWAELYMTVAMLAAHFDFEFVGTTAKDVDPFSDQFIFGTESKYGVRVRASRCET